MPDDPLLTRLAYLYSSEPIRYPHLRLVSFAQWMLESGRGKSALAKEHYNFAGLKYRPEMAAYAKKVMYEAHDGLDAYCKFATLEHFIDGYWAFLQRAPYTGWEAHTDTPEDFIRFIGPTYTPTPGYSEKVLALVPEARRILDAAAASPAPSTSGAQNIGTIVLDPGHGGEAKLGGSSPNNAISVSGVKEKKLALDFCFILRDLLLSQAQAAGQTIRVVLTRTKDINVSIAERASLAGSNNASAFLCWHFNGFHVPQVAGVETYFAAASNGNANVLEDAAFAQAVHNGLLQGMRQINPGAKDRGVKQDSESGPGRMGVLSDIALGNSARVKKCVAAYVEAEFISNPTVDKLLISGPDAIPNRHKVLAKVATAIRDHMATIA